MTKRFREPLLDKLERKYRRYAPRNLMLFIVITTLLVWLLEEIIFIQSGKSVIYTWFHFNRDAILRGEVWRLITFVFLPPEDDILRLALTLYFNWLIGSTVELEWGSFRFDVFYLCGVIGAIISGFITGYTFNGYLNASLFLAYGILNPDDKLLLFFIIPIKAKYLAIYQAITWLFMFFVSFWVYRIALIMAFLNLILFFYKDYIRCVKNFFRKRKYKRESKRDETEYPFDL